VGCVTFATVPVAEMRAMIPDLKSGGFPFPIRHLPAIGSGFARLGRILPFSRGCLLVDETARQEGHAIDVVCIGNRTDEELFGTLREETGIAATRERRDVEMLVARQS
jgi:hypothetical protein